MGEVRVAVVDDDRWRRSAMAVELEARAEIEVVCELDHDAALEWPLDAWSEIDVAVVDVLDEFAPSEIGTDLYAGIMTLHRVQHLPLRTIAIVPHPGNALLALRVYEAGVDGVYHRWELNDIDQLARAVVQPDPLRAPVRPTESELEAFGARVSARVNDAVRTYERSALYGHLATDVGHKSLRLSRRTIDQFRRSIAASGFEGTEQRVGATRRVLAPRWPDVRDYMLRVLGRKDVRHTEHD